MTKTSGEMNDGNGGAAEETKKEDEEEEKDASLLEMKSMLMDTHISDGSGKKKSYWAVSMETMGMAHGKDDQNDLMLETVEQGVPMLKDYMAAKDKQLVAENEKQRSSTKTKKKTGSPVLASWWDLVPLEEFGVSQSFFLKVFLKWTIKEHDDGANGVVAVNDTTTTKEEDTAAKLSVNASKARRRLDAYLEWMHDNMATDMLARPLTLDSVKEVAAVWDMQSTISEDDKYIWWMDIGKMDKAKIKTMDPQEHLRYVVWYSHLIMFDKNAQDHGVILMEDLNKIGFWSTMTLIPIDVGAKMDRLTIGVLPVKMKAIYMFGAARWLHLMMGLMKPFLSKKMRDRMIIVTETIAPDRQQFCDDLVSRASIPDGIMDLKGGTAHDAMFDKLIKKKKKKDKKKKEIEKKAAGGEGDNGGEEGTKKKKKDKKK